MSDTEEKTETPTSQKSAQIAAMVVAALLAVSPLIMIGTNLLGWSSFNIWEIMFFYIAVLVYQALSALFKEAIAQGIFIGMVRYKAYEAQLMAHALSLLNGSEQPKPKPTNPEEVVVPFDLFKRKDD